MFIVSVTAGEEVIETIAREATARGVREAAIVSLVGAVEYCKISNMPVDDASSDILTEHKQPLEMSGTGEIVDGKPHLHCVVSGEGNAAMAGHLHAAVVGSWFVRAYIIEAE